MLVGLSGKIVHAPSPDFVSNVQARILIGLQNIQTNKQQNVIPQKLNLFQTTEKVQKWHIPADTGNCKVRKIVRIQDFPAPIQNSL